MLKYVWLHYSSVSLVLIGPTTPPARNLYEKHPAQLNNVEKSTLMNYKYIQKEHNS